MNNLEFVEKLKDIAENYKTLYVMGCFGAPLNDKNKERYCKNHKYNRQPERTAMIKSATADTFGFDCVCLIKGVLWGWCGEKSKNYGGAKYISNGVPDIGANSMIKKCKNVTTDFSKIKVGEALWCEGHIGVYIGNGLAVECTPRWKNCVQITAVANIGQKAGYDARKWTKHGQLPYITYKAETSAEGHRIGDTVNFVGNTHYVSANSTAGKPCKPGKAVITAIAKGKHPVHLKKVVGGGSTVYGWVDLADIE